MLISHIFIDFSPKIWYNKYINKKKIILKERVTKMAKICDWYRDNSCDCLCDGLNPNCENYSGDLIPDTERDEENEESK